MAPTDIRKFRHNIAALKKRGLITGVDARSVKPTKRLTNLIDRFDDVLSGKATPVKLSKSETANMKAAGYETYKGKVIFPHSANEKVGVSHGHAKLRQPSGVEQVTIPVPYHKLDTYLRDLKKNDKAIDAMKKRDEYFAFRFYGHQSNAIYRNIDLLIDDLERYEAIEEARQSGKAKDMNEVYRNLEIVKVHRSRDWDTQAARIRKERGTYSHAAYVRAKKKRSRSNFKINEYLDRRKEDSRIYRANLTGKDKTAYKKAAKKRAKKSRRKTSATTKGKKK